MPYKIINWGKYQFHSDRDSNPWVKLHRTILLSADFFAIPEVRRWEWPLLLLLANHATGIIEDNDHDIAFKLRYKDWETVPWDCKPFIGKLLEAVEPSGNHTDTIGCLEERRGEKKRGEKKEGVSYSEDFEIFWKASPRTGNKKRAGAQWVRLTNEQRNEARGGVVRQLKWRKAWAKADTKYFIPSWKYMEYWLRDEQWADELEPPKQKTPKHMDEFERDRWFEEQRARKADEAQAKRAANNIAAKGEGTTPDGPERLGPVNVPQQEGEK